MKRLKVRLIDPDTRCVVDPKVTNVLVTLLENEIVAFMISKELEIQVIEEL